MISELSSAFVRSLLVFLFMLSTFLSQPVCGLLQSVAGQVSKGGHPASSFPFLAIMLERMLSMGTYPKC